MGSFSGGKNDMFNPDNYPTYTEFQKLMVKHFNLDNPAPFLSARSWIMVNMDTRQTMFAKQEKEQRQVASLTKIMTTCVVLDYVRKYSLDMGKTFVSVLKSSTTPVLGGTSADLLEGDELNIFELLHGMMLPSGNDAAQSLAIYFGNLVMHKTQNPSCIARDYNANIDPSKYQEEDEQTSPCFHSLPDDHSENLSMDEQQTKPPNKLDEKINECLDQFYELMNQKAEELGMKNSHFAVAHGMHHENNYSSAKDMAELSCHAMQNQVFRDIVIQQQRQTPSCNFKGHMYNWENTNALLKEGFSGIKTGITPTAGPCLSASVNKDG